MGFNSGFKELTAHDFLIFRISLTSTVTKDKSYIFVQIAQEGFCLIEKCDGTLAPDVSGRECLHLPRQEQFTMF